MCGRYYVDDETAKEIERVVQRLNDDLWYSRGEIFPRDLAAVIYNHDDMVTAESMYWGYPDYTNKKIIFNIRSETVKEKRSLTESVMQRRCVIPATGFYEWDSKKNKVRFERNNNESIYMAGIWGTYEETNRFVILTTGANESVSGVHHRMPLILEPDEVVNWIYNNDFTDYILNKIPENLNQIREYEQLALPY